MKKSFLFLGVVALAFTMVVDGIAAERSQTLKVYNWADYIDMDNVLDKFPAWYKEQTGEDVEVVYQTFDINESMLTQIEVGQEDYDVICPSEYIIERMLRENLLLPINKDFGNTPDYTANVAPFVVEKFQEMAPNENVKVSDYAVGYMWGTTGILYNPNFVSEQEVQSWECILNPKFENHIFMKDAFRDIYSVMVLYAYRDAIAKGEVDKDDLVANLTPERIQRVEEILLQAKNNIAGWEVDFGKEEMTKGKAWMNVSWSGDAQWAIDEAQTVGLDLKYIVPQEGSNVWFDGWCIPKYAKNTKAASYFINYMCMSQNAINNMEEIGYVSVIATPEIMEWANDVEANEQTVDLTYFFGEDADSIHANPVFYPDASVIARCALMHDCADKTEDMLSMWNRVKGDNLTSSKIWIILGVLGVIAIMVITHAFNVRRQNALRNKKRKSHRR